MNMSNTGAPNGLNIRQVYEVHNWVKKKSFSEKAKVLYSHVQENVF